MNIIVILINAAGHLYALDFFRRQWSDSHTRRDQQKFKIPVKKRIRGFSEVVTEVPRSPCRQGEGFCPLISQSFARLRKLIVQARNYLRYLLNLIRLTLAAVWAERKPFLCRSCGSVSGPSGLASR